MKTIENLNISFTNEEPDNNEIWACSNYFLKISNYELAEKLGVDADCTEQIKSFLTDQSAIAEGLNVVFWFN